MKNKRVGELEEEKLFKLSAGAIKHRSRPLLQRCFGSVWTELNCQTSSFLDFPLKIYSASLGFCKICLTKGRCNCRGVSLLCTSEEQSRTKQKTVVTGWFGSHWTQCWMIVQLICFQTSYGTIYVCFHSWICRICFDRATARLFVSATRSSWREFNICELDFSNLGPSIFAWLVWFY